MACVSDSSISSSISFRTFLAKLADDLTVSDLKKLKFLLDQPAGVKEKITDPCTYLEFLETKGFIAINKLDYLKEIFNNIGRNDLEIKTNEFIKNKQVKHPVESVCDETYDKNLNQPIHAPGLSANLNRLPDSNESNYDKKICESESTKPVEIIYESKPTSESGPKTLVEGIQAESLCNIARMIPHGCIFMFDLNDIEACTQVEFQLHHEDNNWISIEKTKSDFEYYVTKKKNNKLFIKVENFMNVDEESIDFRFSFRNSNKSCFQKDLENVTISGICSYEITYKGSIVATPELISENDFSSNIRSSNSLEWTDNKMFRGQPIESYAQDYIRRNFRECEDVISFLPNFCNININFVFSKFNDFLVKNKAGVCAVLLGYRLPYHASLLKCSVVKLRRCDDKNRLIIFFSEYNLVIIARITSSLDCIKLESENCLNDVILFINVNKPLIEANNLIILGIVVLPLIDRENLNKELFFNYSDKFGLDKNLFVCKDDLEDEKLEGWWRSHVIAYCDRKNVAQNNNEKLFKKLIGLTMMAMAKVDQCLPTMEADTQKQIQSLILTVEQRNAINDKERKKIITGGYGSGKSIVGKEIVKNIITEMSGNSFTLYYICCNHFTLFECEMKEFVENLEKTSNANIVCENLYWLWKNMCEKENIYEKNAIKNISLSTVLKYLVNTDNNVHFVLEELSEEYVNEKEAIQIKRSMPKESFVVFIPESITKHRELIKNNKKCILQNNCFHDDLIGMKKIHLCNLMRFPECNKLAIDSAQETIIKSKTVFNFPNEKVDNTYEVNENFVSEENSMQVQPKENFFANSRDDSTKDLNNEITNVTLTDHTKLNPTREITVNDTIDGKNEDFYDNDRDHMSKNLAENANNEDSLRKMETIYSFKSGKIGHAIKGVKPKVLYFPFHDIANKQSVKIISVVLQSLQLSRKTVIICYNIKEAQSVSYAIDVMKNYKAVPYLPHLRKFNPTADYKLSIKKELKSHREILITDSKGYSGAEAESVIVIVSPEEVYLRHALVDYMARSTFRLIIFALASNNSKTFKTDQTIGTIGNVLSDLFKVVESIKITVCDNGDPMWRYTGSSLVINKSCKEFNDLGEKMDFDIYKENPEFQEIKQHASVYEEQANQQSDDGMAFEEFENEAEIRNIKMAQEVLHSHVFKLHFSEIVGVDWKHLGQFLGIEEPFLNAVDLDYTETVEKAYAIVSLWIQRCKNPTFEELKTALQKMNRMDLVSKVGELTNNTNYNFENEFVPGWDCPVCTYHNTPTYPGCMICSTERPKNYVVPENFVVHHDESNRLFNNSLPQLIKRRTETHSTYTLNSDPVGICHVICNNFEEFVLSEDDFRLSNRRGTQKDVIELKKVFLWLNFKVKVHYNKDASSILDIIKKPFLNKNQPTDCFVCCILSHGFTDGVYGSDGKKLKFSDMQTAINGYSAEWLVGKPKLFFIQACQGTDEEAVEPINFHSCTYERTYEPINFHSNFIEEKFYTVLQTNDEEEVLCVDAPIRVVHRHTTSNNLNSLAKNADFCFSVAAIPGTVSWRHTSEGSWYIQSLCQVLKEHALHYSLLDMLTFLNNEIAMKTQPDIFAKQMSTLRIMTLTKRLYFNPKGSFVKPAFELVDEVSDIEDDFINFVLQ